MIKFKVIFILTVSLMFCFMPTLAASEVTPTPPSWVVDGEYVTFKNSVAYEPETWGKICNLRKEIEDNAVKFEENLIKFVSEYENVNDAGLYYELGLIYHKYYLNNRFEKGHDWFIKSADLLEHGEKQKIVYMWNARTALFSKMYIDYKVLNEAMCKFIDYPDYNVREIIVSDEMLEYLDNSEKLFLEEPLLTIDKTYIQEKSLPPEIVNGKFMIPVKTVLRMIGGVSELNTKTQEVTLVRAGDTFKLTVGSDIAYKNGKKIILDATPYIKRGVVFLSSSFVSEQFGQVVTWAEKPMILDISENKDASKSSNLEKWLLPMGSYINQYPKIIAYYIPTRDVRFFTGYPVRRSFYSLKAIDQLKEAWDIYNREDLLEQIESLTNYGHNSSFLEYFRFIDGMTDKEYENLLKEVSGIDEYMFPLNKEIGEKWGKRGIMAWDLFRVSNLAQWGYMAGYLTYNEALAAAEPAARKLQKNFSSWEEAYDNYVDGHVWWSRTDVRGIKYEEWGRRQECKELMQKHKEMFDDSLFKRKIISVEGVDL